MNIVYVTGTDSKYFLHTGILIQAFKKQCPVRTLYVCDFGLSDSQRTILSKYQAFIPKPLKLPEHLHPWFYKSSIEQYVSFLSPDIVVWLDSDCFPTGPFSHEVEKIISTWEIENNRAAICRGKVGKSWKLASPPGNIRHFNMNPEYPYYNSGIWILRSKEVLAGWKTAVESAPQTGMFEQDAFNFLLHKYNTSIYLLENDIWNVTHDSLDKVICTENNEITLNGRSVLILHVTGSYINTKISIGPFEGYIRALKNPALKNVQLALLKEWITSITAAI